MIINRKEIKKNIGMAFKNNKPKKSSDRKQLILDELKKVYPDGEFEIAEAEFDMNNNEFGNKKIMRQDNNGSFILNTLYSALSEIDGELMDIYVKRTANAIRVNNNIYVSSEQYDLHFGINNDIDEYSTLFAKPRFITNINQYGNMIDEYSIFYDDCNLINTPGNILNILIVSDGLAIIEIVNLL